LQNNPNPFNPSTAIKFYIPNDSRVKVAIYDILGREITTLTNEQKQAGYHIIYWNGKDRNGSDVASGVYLYRLFAGNYVKTKKMNLLK
jgi:flagellar hook assembly protein FlgD